MYRPYAIRPSWEMKRAALAVAKCYGGGGTSSTPMVPPEFAPLINASVQNMIAQQGANPIGGYNAGNPMGVQGLTQGQTYGMGMMAGSGMVNPMDYLAAQANQRQMGMAGGGPLTGSYDPSGEMGLQDWANYMNPYFGSGGEMGFQLQQPNALIAAMGSNVQGQAPGGTNFGGGAPNMSGPPPGAAPAHQLAGDAAMAPQGAMQSNGRQMFGPSLNRQWTPPPQAGGANLSASGPAWNPIQSGAFDGVAPFSGTPDQMRALQPYMDMMTTPAATRRAAGDPSTWAHFQAGQNGMPTFNGFQYTGAQHEFGGNSAIAEHFLQNGATPQQFAQFLLQGANAQEAVHHGPQSAARRAAGQDDFGNQMPHPDQNFMQNLRATRTANGMGNAGMGRQ